VLETLITSKTRVKLLLKFFLNSNTTSYLRDLAAEFGTSTNAIRIELNRLEDAGLLNTRREGNKKLFKANRKHPLYENIHNLLLRHTGIDHLVEKVAKNLGGLHSAYVINSFARGIDSEEITVILVGTDIDEAYLENAAAKAEAMISRRIAYIIVSPGDAPGLLKHHPEALLVWKDLPMC